ncbi:hypothetical protein V6N11_061733 [Hibiscus sabdariffa]|uniref:Uncharacterized protein n=2 Tax=Hibiscus sabdariffa TaxID=183260 RepID=A0ABR2N774_9ROSI
MEWKRHLPRGLRQRDSRRRFYGGHHNGELRQRFPIDNSKFDRLDKEYRVCRRGVAVFVNFVSKRIHPSTLKEAFEVYGKVIDVFIAFNSVKRRGMRSTFAFVRFSNPKEAMNAIKGANN